MANETSSNPFAPFTDFDWSKFDVNQMMGNLKMPGVDMDTLMATQRKNIEALTNANQVAMQGMQSLARRQSEIMAQSVAEMSEMAKQVTASGNPQEMSAKQAELFKEAFEKALANMRELAEMIAKSNSDAFAVINQRLSESIEEMKSMMVEKK